VKTADITATEEAPARADGERTRVREQLSALAAELLERRGAILASWRAAGETAGERSVASSLSNAQFNDHVPAILDCLAATMRSWPDEHAGTTGELQDGQVCDHGMQRWQQGYQLRELVREWGHLQICVGEELESYAAANPGLDPAVMPTARRAWTQLCANSITDSATEYWRLHQAESAGHVHDLEEALAALKTLEQSRAEAWRMAAHDLRGSVTVVKGATTLLHGGSPKLGETDRVAVAEVLNQSVTSLHDMLTDLLSLARLDAGHEQLELTKFDAAALLRDFCRASESTATDRGLTLKTDGPETLPVEGDRTKILRIVQNLLLNAIKYTPRGGVTVTWGVAEGRATDRWTFSVQDTGPGIDGNDAAPLAQELHEATVIADGVTPNRSAAVALPSASKALPQSMQPGEGVGLSIVKRLCELLDAGLELATGPEKGSTFRVVLPRSYAVARA
jgi:signal transduction histidine kinase